MKFMTINLIISLLFFTFLITNIPTAILAGIYLNEKNKIDVKRSMEKMKINDL